MDIYPPGVQMAGRYEVAGRPLMGGMGIVYLCFDHQEQRPVALKTFKPKYLPDRAARDRFLREGTAWVNLGKHPHIVRCYGVERMGDGREVYLVLEAVAKEQDRPDASLRSWLISGRPLPMAQSLLFALQIVRGMKHATDTVPGFVHRDLKPENLLVGADQLSSMDMNRLRVTDFGLAAALQETGGKDQAAETGMQEDWRQFGRTQLTQGLVGTPLYMAPEQWRGEKVSVATDVYALGCILYEMLTGQRAAEGRSLAALKQAHCAGKLRPLPDALPSVVQKVVKCCLVVEPAERYGTWWDVEEALEAAYSKTTGQVAPELQPGQALDRAERVATGWSYSAIGASYVDIGKAEIAAGYFKRAVEMGQVEGEQRLIGSGLTGLGLAHRDLGQFAQAVEETEQALRIACEFGDKRAEKAVLGNLGTCYRQLGRLDDALACLEQCLSIVREIGDQTDEGNVLSGFGLFYQETGQVDKAIHYHKEHLDLASKTEDWASQVAALINLGICHFVSGQNITARSYHQQALGLAHEVGDLRGEGRALAGLGQCCFLTDPSEAIRYLERSLSIARELGDRQSEAGALAALAGCSHRLGRLKEAEQLARESLKMTDEMGIIRTSAGTCVLLTTLMVQQQRQREALSFAQRAEEVFTHIGPVEHAQRAQQLVAQIRAMMH